MSSILARRVRTGIIAMAMTATTATVTGQVGEPPRLVLTLKK